MFKARHIRTGARGVSTGGVANADLANMADATVKLRATGSGSGPPIDGTGIQLGEICRFGTTVVLGAGTYSPYSLGATTNTIIFTGTSTVHGFTDISAGREITCTNGAAFGSGVTISFVQFSSSVSSTPEKMLLATTQGTDAVSVVLPPGGTMVLRASTATGLDSGLRWRQQDGFQLTTTQNANTVIANATASVAVPTAVSVGTNTVVGRVAGNVVAAALVPQQLAVLASSIAVPFDVFVTCASGGSSGTPDDVTIWNANAPFALRILDAQLRVSTAVGGSSAALRTASGGGGSVVLPDPGTATQTFSTAATGVLEDLATATATVAANGSLFLRRSDRSVVGELVLNCIRT